MTHPARLCKAFRGFEIALKGLYLRLSSAGMVLAFTINEH